MLAWSARMWPSSWARVLTACAVVDAIADADPHVGEVGVAVDLGWAGALLQGVAVVVDEGGQVLPQVCWGVTGEQLGRRVARDRFAFGLVDVEDVDDLESAQLPSWAFGTLACSLTVVLAGRLVVVRL